MPQHTYKTPLKHYIPVVFLGLAAAALIVLGTLSAARAQPLPQQFSIENGDALPQSTPSQTKRFQPVPLNPHPQGPYSTHQSSLQATRIGTPGALPTAPQQPDQQANMPPENWQKMPSISDVRKASKQSSSLGPDLTEARKRGDLLRLKKTAPAPNPDFAALGLNNKAVSSALVSVRLKSGSKEAEEMLSWRLNPLEYPIFIEKVNALNEPLNGFVTGSPSGSDYKFIEVRLIGEDGTTYAPVSVYQNRVRLPGKTIPLEDENNSLQSWLLGTAKRYGQKEKISQLIKIYSYEQCKTLGHTVVDSAPRQCILPDGTTFVQLPTPLTEKAKTYHMFDDCLKDGQPLVNTFPRQCVAPGGRVFIEPPRL